MEGAGSNLFCAAARGTTIVTNAGARIATTTNRISGTTTLVFVVPALYNVEYMPTLRVREKITYQFIVLRFGSYLVELNRRRSLSYTEDLVSEDRTKMAWKRDARMGSYFFSDPKAGVLFFTEEGSVR